MTKLIIIMAGLFWLTLFNTYAGRGELSRFTLLHDRILVDRELREINHNHFLQIDLMASSGLLDLFNDISNISDSNESSLQKRLDTLAILGRNVNTEKTIDLLVSAGIPLPTLSIAGKEFYSSLLYDFHAGVMISVNNEADPVNPVAQTYVRKQMKRGFSTLFKAKKDQTYQVSLYQMLRSDTEARINATTLSTDGEFFNLDELNQDETTLNMDFLYHKHSSHGSWDLGIRELKLYRFNDIRSLYGQSPLFHGRYTWFHRTHYFKIDPFVGFQHRKRYKIPRSLYGGFHLALLNDSLPFTFTFKASNQFLTFMPQMRLKWFHFSYSFKNPFRNPQDDVWVSSLHNIQLHFPFP